MGGAQGSQSSDRSSQTVWGGQKKYLKDLYARAQSEIANDPLQYYPGQTVASQDPATLGYQSSALDYAQSGGPTSQYLSDTVGGRYLDPASNPYLRGTYDTAARAVTENYRDAVLPALESRFARAGQAYSGQYEGARSRADQALGTSLADLGTSIYGGNYQAERGRQQQAAPMLAADTMDRLDLRRGVGADREGYQQSLLDELIRRFEFAQNEPAMRLSRYSGLLGSPVTLGSSSAGSKSFGFNVLAPG